MTHTLQGKHVLVTGAGGFIGSHLCEALVKTGAHVTALIKYNSANDLGHLKMLRQSQPPNLDIKTGNIEDPFFTRSLCENQDIIFHLAALIGIPYSYIAPASYVRTNIEGTLNLLEAAKLHKVKRFIHTSTSEVYGSADYTPIDEAHPLKGQSPYSASKIGADKIAESYFRSFECPIVTLRPFNTFGPRQSARAVIPTIIAQALKGRTIKIGDLSPVRDMTYVSDTASGFIAAAVAENIEGETINLGTGQASTIGDILQEICSLIETGVDDFDIQTDEARIRPVKSEVLELLSNNTKAQNCLQWTPKVSLKAGLKQTIEYMRAHLGDYQTDQYVI